MSSSMLRPTWATERDPLKDSYNDAPSDNVEYVRKNGEWVAMSNAIESDVINPDGYYVRRLGGWVLLEDVQEVGEAPTDEKSYMRKDGQWVAVETATAEDVKLGLSEGKIVTPKSLDGLLDRVGIQYDSSSGGFFFDEGTMSL